MDGQDRQPSLALLLTHLQDPGTWHHLHRNVTPILSFEKFRKNHLGSLFFYQS